MLANYQTDESGRLQSLTTYPLDETRPTLELPDDFALAALRDYVVRDGALVLDPLPPAEPTAQKRIAELKSKLAATDYAVIKIAEGAATADEYADVIAQRAEWRRKINALQAQEGGQA